MMRMISCWVLKSVANMETYFQCKLHGQRTIQVKNFDLVHAIVRMHATFLDGGIVKMLIYDPSLLYIDWRRELRS
ncbi:hypothetical protein MTR67_018116 [Solanum verrucosum]|uniref:Uncharacterized protein n=1 Tax=Solanum verrucosum TaxID=315347 RepID=A0AAF0QQ64_SOLVR|nr:hypothetical protein MTR67_018116 [Solanum verrucosum]